LSGGQQQRVAICRALVYEPKVLLLDEPLSNLDAKLREEARFWIRKLILELGTCAIMVTHDQAEALAMADHVLLLKDGVIVQQGAPIDIYSNPETFYSAEFLGTNNVPRGRLAVSPGRVSIIGDGWELPGSWRGSAQPAEGQPARAVVRVERVGLSSSAVPGAVEMQHDASLFVGDKWEHRLRRGDLRMRAYGPKRLAGGSVWLEIAPDDVWLFEDALS
jgi:iron(III) transport system ATP-binding protein